MLSSSSISQFFLENEEVLLLPAFHVGVVLQEALHDPGQPALHGVVEGGPGHEGCSNPGHNAKDHKT